MDLQDDFLPAGALAVPDGDAVVPLANSLAQRFGHVALTQDWHVPGHLSVASSHAGPFETITLPYGPQILWPDHWFRACILQRSALAMLTKSRRFSLRCSRLSVIVPSPSISPAMYAASHESSTRTER